MDPVERANIIIILEHAGCVVLMRLLVFVTALAVEISRVMLYITEFAGFRTALAVEVSRFFFVLHRVLVVVPPLRWIGGSIAVRLAHAEALLTDVAYCVCGGGGPATAALYSRCTCSGGRRCDYGGSAVQ